MKIALLNDSFPPVVDGVANVVFNYADRLNRMKDNEVVVSTPFYPQADYSSYPFSVVPYSSLPTEALTGGYRAGKPISIRELRALASFEPDIIHAHSPFSSLFLARSLRSAANAPLVFTYHTKYDIEVHRVLSDKVLQKESLNELVRNISSADEVWTVSSGAGENLRSIGFRGNYRVMENGVDFPKGRTPEQTIKEVTGHLDLPSSVPVFLFVGRMMKYKGIPLIIDALAKLAQETDFRMILVGSGSDRDELILQSMERGLSVDSFNEGYWNSVNGSLEHGKLIFTGPVYDRDELRAYNCRSDLFIFPSTFDTSGLVVKEAAACGLASVLIRGSCASEGVTDGRNGYLIDESADSLYSLFRYACDHTEELHQSGEHAMNELYRSWDDAVQEAYSCYGNLIDRFRFHKTFAQPADHEINPLIAMAGRTAQAANETSKVLETYRLEYEGMMDNIDSLRTDAKSKLNNWLSHFKQ